MQGNETLGGFENSIGGLRALRALLFAFENSLRAQLASVRKFAWRTPSAALNARSVNTERRLFLDFNVDDRKVDRLRSVIEGVLAVRGVARSNRSSARSGAPRYFSNAA